LVALAAATDRHFRLLTGSPRHRPATYTAAALLTDAAALIEHAAGII